MINYVEKLNEKMFEDVIIFSFSELGAMGPNDMTFYKKNGESFSVDYKTEDTPYALLKELFWTLKECYWNGPMRNESAAFHTIVIGGSLNDKETRVANGWRHIYLDVGNHLAVKKEYYSAVREIFTDRDNCDITFSWTKMLETANFHQKIESIEKAFYEQQKADEHLANVLKELKQNPEYIRKVKETHGNMDQMMVVLEEFSGIKMTWFELKQFGLRQQGLI